MPSRALNRAVAHCMRTQHRDGSWEANPDPRVAETALACLVLGWAGSAAAAHRAARWLRTAAPQSHHPAAETFENVLRALALGEHVELDLHSPVFADEVISTRARILHVMALRSGRGGTAHSRLRADIERACAGVGTTRLKPWTHVELLACHALLEAHVGEHEKARRAGLAIAERQAPDGSFFGNPISTALAFAALEHGSPAWHAARRHLLTTQHPDGTWRFCSSNVWDTTLTMRAFRGTPEFDAHCLPAAVAFLGATQNPDGGWPFRSEVESDNDTTSAALIALAGQHRPEWTERALTYFAQRQTGEGLWRTWQFLRDPPAEDVVAHVVTALDHYDHHLSCTAARAWLADRWTTGGRWTASWYRGLPYATLEVGEALGDHPVVELAARSLAAAQNPDGGWPAEPGGPSAASTTGLALAVLHRSGLHDAQVWCPAVDFLVGTQRADGTWPGVPEMYGPRPLLTHFQTHTQAFVVLGVRAALSRKELRAA